jgi:ubiquinone/menaquinone biosynthesis C-methylase UbiE
VGAVSHLSGPVREVVQRGIEHFLRERLLGRIEPDVIKISAKEILLEFLETGAALEATTRVLESVDKHTGAVREDRAETLAEHFLSLIARPASVSTIVDVGCGRGLMTRRLVARLGLPSEQAFGLDVTKHPLLSDDNFTFGLVSDGILPVDSHSADVVTVNMVLHHAVNPEAVCAEIARIVSVEGQVIFRDHDANDESVEVLTDVIEIVMDAWRGGPRPEHADATNYKTMSSWIDLFRDQRLLVSEVQEPPPENPYRPFTAVFQPGPR